MIRTSEADGVLELRLDRPEKKNALTAAMYESLDDGLAAAASSSTVRVVLFAAEGDVFSAGNDINDFQSRGGDAGATPATRFIRALARFAKPLVAAVQGRAVGIGTTMLLHCDLVYAAPEASFSTPFTRLGLVPEAGSSLLLPRRIGPARAAAMLLLGETMDASEAASSGLVNAVVARDGLAAHARDKAIALAALPADAVRASRALLRGEAETLAARIDREQEAFASALRSPEARDAFAAFLSRTR